MRPPRRLFGSHDAEKPAPRRGVRRLAGLCRVPVLLASRRLVHRLRPRLRRRDRGRRGVPRVVGGRHRRDRPVIAHALDRHGRGRADRPTPDAAGPVQPERPPGRRRLAQLPGRWLRHLAVGAATAPRQERRQTGSPVPVGARPWTASVATWPSSARHPVTTSGKSRAARCTRRPSGACIAGLQAAASLLGRPTLAERAEMVRTFLSTRGGAWAASPSPTTASRSTPPCCGCASPSGVVAPDEPAFVETVRRVVAELDLDGGRTPVPERHLLRGRRVAGAHGLPGLGATRRPVTWSRHEGAATGSPPTSMTKAVSPSSSGGPPRPRALRRVGRALAHQPQISFGLTLCTSCWPPCRDAPKPPESHHPKLSQLGSQQ